jgi:3-oxoacyl-[acyl-carrier protein] reductase
MDLTNETVIVNGAASGIGRATALRFARAGAAVVFADVDAGGLREVEDEIAAAGGRAASKQADITLERDARAVFALARNRFGAPTMLANVAGVVEGLDDPLSTYPDCDPARWTRMLDINLTALIRMTQLAIDEMRTGGGAIVNVASGAGMGLGPHDAPVYAASKAGVVRFTAALGGLRKEAGIRVNCICPGWVDTPMVQRNRTARTPAQWRAIAPPVMLAAHDIAGQIVRLATDRRLGGRILLYYEGEKPRLLPARPG